MGFLIKVFIFISFFISITQAQTQQNIIRALRVDPSFFYNIYPGRSASEISDLLVTQAKASGVNTLFIYAYNTIYGAYYPTSYNLTTTENGYGQLNIFKELTNAAKKNNMKVIATIPVNNFKHVWVARPAWRAKTITGTDYIPKENLYMLSAWHPQYRTWLTGFCKDLLNRNPGIDGIEATEPFVDYYWRRESDYNPIANKKFKIRYPNGQLGDSNWLMFRAQGLTDLIAIMSTAVHSVYKQSYLVQTWPVKIDGTLFSSDVIRDNIGLDLNGLLNLTGSKKLNYLMAELIWQQWAAEYGGNVFTPTWTRGASATFINFINKRSIPLLHVEITPFSGAYGQVTPSLQEFIDTLISIRDLNVGIDVYDHSQVFDLNAWDALLYWN